MTVTHFPTQRRVVAVRTIAWLLVSVALYDGAGLAFGGPAFTGSDTYAALRLVPGGMRAWGVLLLVGAAAVAWGIGQEGAGHRRAFNTVLSLGAGYYLLWAVVIPGTWIKTGSVPAWGAESKVLLLLALYYACARAVAPRREAGSGAR